MTKLTLLRGRWLCDKILWCKRDLAFADKKNQRFHMVIKQFFKYSVFTASNFPQSRNQSIGFLFPSKEAVTATLPEEIINMWLASTISTNNWFQIHSYKTLSIFSNIKCKCVKPLYEVNLTASGLWWWCQYYTYQMCATEYLQYS